jgi:tripartite-type tricarboxylate transporter receptor subunit TctC
VATTATISGEVQVFFSNTIPDVMPHVETKRLRALGVTSVTRQPTVPNIPTLAESGLPGYEFTSWHVLAVPAATPRALITQINEKIRSTLSPPEAIQRWRERGVEVVAGTPDAAAAHLKKEVQKWRVVFKERGMKAD